MQKFCVFCGQKPQSKNKEHIIPYWLIAYTGDPNRKVKIGIDWRQEPPQIRSFSYSSFTMPACTSCNSEYSQLEAIVKEIILKILNHNPLGSLDFHQLLNWFDKVRVGLWLSFYYLDKNLGNIHPNYQIASRICMHDRMLHIVRIDSPNEELSFRGADMPSFYYTPSCFNMIINNISFMNISNPMFISRRLGFPYPDKQYLLEDGQVRCDIVDGLKRSMSPIIRSSLRFQGTGIYQPIFRSQLLLNGRNDLYDNDYVHSNCMDYDSGIGKIFIENNRTVSLYPDTETAIWVPTASYSRASINPNISISTMELQTYIDSLLPSTELLSEGKRKWFRDMKKKNKTFNAKIIESLRENARRRGT